MTKHLRLVFPDSGEVALAAAMVRWASLSRTWTSFSASAKVAVETSGPTGGADPKVGGVPGWGVVVASLRWARQATPAPRRSGAWMRNCRRVGTWDLQVLLKS